MALDPETTGDPAPDVQPHKMSVTALAACRARILVVTSSQVIIARPHEVPIVGNLLDHVQRLEEELEACREDRDALRDLLQRKTCPSKR